jgi:hypothetical protein
MVGAFQHPANGTFFLMLEMLQEPLVEAMTKGALTSSQRSKRQLITAICFWRGLFGGGLRYWRGGL